MYQIYFVDINTSADSISGIGTIQSCFNYKQFIVSLATNDDIHVNNYYYLKGYRNVINSGTSGSAISAENIWILSKKNVYIYSWNNEPWRINFINDFYLESSVNWFNSIHIRNGILKYVINKLKFSINTSVSAFYENCWLDGAIEDSSSEYSGGELFFINCTLNRFKLNNNNFNKIYFINTIIENPISNNYHLIDNTIYSTFYFDNVVSNRYILNQSLSDRYNVLNPSVDYGLGVTYSIAQSANIQNAWDSSSLESGIFTSAISAISKDLISYVYSDFKNITVSGNTLYNYTWWDGQRDGIGALYFPNITINLSANGNTTSANVFLNDNINFNWNNIFNSFNATSAILNYDDYIVSAFTTTSATSTSYVYKYNIKTVNPSLTVYSKNNWYYVTSGITLNLLLSSAVSASFTILNETLNNITSANTDQKILLSSFNISGDVYEYIWNFGDGTSSFNSSYTSFSAIPIEYKTYKLSDYYNISLLLNNSYLTSANFLVQRAYSAYYVDLDINYTNSGDGTESNPFNYYQFYNRIKTNGDGVYGDTYYLKNLREINVSGYNNVFEVDRMKNFVFDAWNTSSFGPWVFVFNGNNEFSVNNIIGSFHGVTLKNSIIYTKPLYKPPFQYLGSKIIYTNMYNVYVVQNGELSNFVIEPFNYLVSSTYTSAILSSCYVSGTSSFTSGGYGVVAKTVGQWNRLTNGNSTFGGNFDIETYVVAPSAVSGTSTYSCCHRLFSINGDMLIDLGYIMHPSPSRVLYTSGNTASFVASASVNFSAYKKVGLKITRNNNSISAFYNEDGINWIMLGPVMVYSGNCYTEVICNAPSNSANKPSFDSFFYQAVSGLPYYSFSASATPSYSAISASLYLNTYIYDDFETSSMNSWWNTAFLNNWTVIEQPPIYYTSGVSGFTSSTYISYNKEQFYINNSSDIVGSTIYIPNNVSAVTDISANEYILNLIDSVLCNFGCSANQLSSCSANILNCAFNNSNFLSGSCFIINNKNSQYNFVIPENSAFPFHMNNILYGKDMNYIYINRKLLKPFTGISATPNPGYGYPNYPNYEIGLFGYLRKNYIL